MNSPSVITGSLSTARNAAGALPPRPARTPRVERRPDQSGFPLSFSQQRIWVLNQIEPGNHYNDQFRIRLRGPLEHAVLRRALNEIFRRHENLRASFGETSGHPVQRIARELELSVPLSDWRDLEAGRRAEEVKRAGLEEIALPFQLNQPPLARARLLHLAEADHVLFLTFHHIVIDGWSRGVFMRELALLYAAFLEGKDSPLPELPIQYADYAAWQGAGHRENNLRHQLDYWRKQLSGAPSFIELPTDYPRPALQNYRGASVPVAIDPSLTDHLKKISRQEGGTLFMTLLAAFKVLISRYTGEEDVVVGSPIANRTRPELEGLIGYFLNMLVLRTDLSGNPSFRSLLGRICEVSLNAYHQMEELPFERLVAELQPDRNPSYAPLFQHSFVLQNTPMLAARAGLLTFEPEAAEVVSSKYDLTLSLTETSHGLTGHFEYAANLFEPDRMRRMAGHFTQLLQGIATQPEQRLSRLPLLAPAERQQVLVDWNQTAAPWAAPALVHELVEEQARRQPNAIAVVFGRERLSYAELNARADLWAAHLRAQGVGPEKLVGLCVERSVEMLVALLAVFKAGGAYLPLDPAYPKERLARMLEDAGTTLVLSQKKWLPLLSGATSPVLTLEGLAQAPPPTFSPSAGHPGQLAYVIFTSGSTGRPKGVAVTHRSLVNFLSSMQRRPGFEASDTLLAITTLSFDIAGLEIWLPLVTGGRVELASHETILDPRALADLISSSGATVMQATPTFWRSFVAAGWAGSPHLKILCGGEMWSGDLANQLLSRGASLWNLYGPTETTIWSTVHQVRAGEPVWLGSPIANTQLYLLDRHLEPVPIGVPGEIFIGGSGVARGYVQAPDLTAQKFIPDPFSTDPDARLYRTGDLARYQGDGRLQFLGRTDAQVKIRGHRIEPGEIEARLGEHPAVRACVVGGQTLANEVRLIAHVVAGEKITADELRDHLRGSLPEFMLPTAFVFLPSLPLTPAGKIDRKSLPEPEAARPELRNAYAPPKNELEQTVGGIWQEVLGPDLRVGRHDNFFDLGGHSLLVVRVHARLRETLRRDFPVIQLFQHPTVAAIAEYLGHATEADSARGLDVSSRAARQRAAMFHPQLQEVGS